MKIRDKLISNATYLFLYWGFTTFFTMIFWVMLGKTLLPASYGIVATGLQLSALLSPITLLGMRTTLNKLIPEFLQKKQKDRIQGLVNFSFKLALVASALIAIALFLLSPYLSPLIKVEEKILWLIGISIIVTSLSTIAGGFYYGIQDMKRFFLTELYGDVALVLSVALLIFLGAGYIAAIIAYILRFSISFITRISRRMFKISRKPSIDKNLIFKYSIPAFIVVFFSMLFNNTQFIILSSLKSVEITGSFAVAMKIAYVMPVLPTVLSSALFPITSQISADNESKSKRARLQSYLIRLVFRYNILFIFPLATAMIIFSDYLILFFSSQEYLSATTFMPFLAFGGAFFGLASIFLTSLFAIGRPKDYRNSFIISTFLYLVLSATLTYYFSSWGLSIAYMLSSIFFLLVTVYYIRKRLTLKLHLGDMGRVVIGTFVSFLFLLLVRPYVHDFLMAGVAVLISAIIYSLVLLKLGFCIEEDLKILDSLAKKTPLFKKQISWVRRYLSKFVIRDYKF